MRETLEAERQGAHKHMYHVTCRKKQSTNNLTSLEKEMSELKLVANQNATLNSQLRKGLKHLATCKRRKCSVCAYTKAEFQSAEANLHSKHRHE